MRVARLAGMSEARIPVPARITTMATNMTGSVGETPKPSKVMVVP